MPGVEQNWSEKPVLTALAGNDKICTIDTSQTDLWDKNTTVTLADFFGATTGIPVDITMEQSGANPTITTNRTSGATTVLASAATFGYVGTSSNSTFRILTDNNAKVKIYTSTGIFENVATYSHDMNGETIRAIYVNDSGEFGYDSSTKRHKINPVTITIEDIEFLLSLRPVIYQRETGTLEAGLLAEEVAEIKEDIITYETYEVDENEELKKIQMSYFENKVDFRDIEKNKKIKIKANRFKNKDEETEEIEMNVMRVPETVEYYRLIPYLLAIVQFQQQQIDNFESRIVALEKK